MGSRRGRHAALTAALALGAGCSVGAPPGFSTGDTWSFPLVGPLENGLLITPVTINGHGPFLFAIDPDAMISVVDDEIVTLAKLRVGPGPRRLDETDTQQTRFYAEVLDLKVGSLAIERRSAVVVPQHTYDADGRRILGLLGRDVIADSLVFGFDRDQGFAYLSTQKAWKLPPGTTPLTFTTMPSQIVNTDSIPAPRCLVHVSVGGQNLTMHLDLGARLSQLRETLWPKAKLEPKPSTLRTADEAGTVRTAAHIVESPGIAIAGKPGERLTFLPYEDRRWESEDLDGTLGLDFFEPYDVWASWDATAFYVKPRTPVDPVQRIERWGDPSCANPGCVRVSLIDPTAGKPLAEGAPHPGVVISVAREKDAPGGPLEVMVSAVPRDGQPPLPTLVVNMPAGQMRTIGHLHAEYAGAKLTVIDASPFPRSCPGEGGCIDALAATGLLSATGP